MQVWFNIQNNQCNNYINRITKISDYFCRYRKSIWQNSIHICNKKTLSELEIEEYLFYSIKIILKNNMNQISSLFDHRSRLIISEFSNAYFIADLNPESVQMISSYLILLTIYDMHHHYPILRMRKQCKEMATYLFKIAQLVRGGAKTVQSLCTKWLYYTTIFF